MLAGSSAVVDDSVKSQSPAVVLHCLKRLRSGIERQIRKLSHFARSHNGVDHNASIFWLISWLRVSRSIMPIEKVRFDSEVDYIRWPNVIVFNFEPHVVWNSPSLARYQLGFHAWFLYHQEGPINFRSNIGLATDGLPLSTSKKDVSRTDDNQSNVDKHRWRIPGFLAGIILFVSSFLLLGYSAKCFDELGLKCRGFFWLFVGGSPYALGGLLMLIDP